MVSTIPPATSRHRPACKTSASPVGVIGDASYQPVPLLTHPELDDGSSLDPPRPPLQHVAQRVAWTARIHAKHEDRRQHDDRAHPRAKPLGHAGVPQWQAKGRGPRPSGGRGHGRAGRVVIAGQLGICRPLPPAGHASHLGPIGWLRRYPCPRALAGTRAGTAAIGRRSRGHGELRRQCRMLSLAAPRHQTPPNARS